MERRPEQYRAAAEHRPTHPPQALRLELEPDHEQHQHDAELGEVHDRFDVLDEPQSPRADRHAGDEIAEHRAEAEPPEDRHREDARGEEHEGLLQKAVRFHV